MNLGLHWKMLHFLLAASGVIILFARLIKRSYWEKSRTIFGKLKTCFGHASVVTGYTGQEVM
jgi:hypothetical protein